MNTHYENYVSPINLSKLRITQQSLTDESDNKFPISNGIPNFIYPHKLPESDISSINWYRNNAKNYDELLPLTFKTFGLSEHEERQKLINALELESNHKVLEFGCGSGRDSVYIADILKSQGELYLQDISPDILSFCVDKFKDKKQDNIHISLANGSYLPFKNNYFDRVFHFGGINTFGDIKRTLQEVVRVVKVGGRVVIGDENMPVWLRETNFGKILMNSNPHYKYQLPLEHMPVEARNVKLEWFIGGVFYFISFDVGQGEPEADFDFPIPGIRGGTHRTRFYNNLEGVSDEAFAIAHEKCKKSGKSMSDWLSDLIIS